MSDPPLRLQLSWEDPATGELRTPVLSLPIALGRDFAHMPAQIDGQRVSRMVLDSGQVSRFHALLRQAGDEVVVDDQRSSNGTFVNGDRQASAVLSEGDRLLIGPYTLTLTWSIEGQTGPSESESSTKSTILFPEASAPTSGASFPPLLFQQPHVSLRDLMDTGLPIREFDYVALGAGLGSFVWVDLLRLGGVPAQQILAIGMEAVPYARYQRLCLNSQIPPHERLRSNSDSCPDNIWGWPSYALREAWDDLGRGKLAPALRYLWQVFAEPTLAETYTPRSGRVFASIDREAERIGWNHCFDYGRIRSIRQTTDGRYAIAYSRSTADRRDHAFVVARYLHLATGYPAIQFLPDLQAYRAATHDFNTVVNAYEEHDHVYQHLETFGGTVMIRGRGIVASRVVQRIYEARQTNPQIYLLHLMRSPKPSGHRFRTAQRQVKNHYELQPFNWPKACWSGDLRVMLEQASPSERQRLLADWGGTTTADRRDWQQIVQEGLRQGWYKIEFGEVERVEPSTGQGTLTHIRDRDFKGTRQLQADFIIDATGLDAQVSANPLLDDLVTCYGLPLNPLGRLAVSQDFELPDLRSGQGRVYAAGAMTLGGPYAAVDSFLGLQYAALRSVDSLAAAKAPGLHRLSGVRSLLQWMKWVMNVAP
ncbi:MAG: FHA domain-containing protein [Elainellaceae cyanobacterium]